MKKTPEKAAALKYRREKDNAPRVVAKGRAKVAEQIIKVARAHGIPVHEDRELVEFLSMLDLYQEIPPELYKAVAEVLVFIYSLKARVAPTE